MKSPEQRMQKIREYMETLGFIVETHKLNLTDFEFSGVWCREFE